MTAKTELEIAPAVELHKPPQMTADEARDHLLFIRRNAASIGQYLIALRDREGWRALGYQSFTAMLRGEFTESRQHLYDLMRSATVNERLHEAGLNVTLPSDQADVLARLAPELQPVVYSAAKARATAQGQKVTVSRLQRTAEVLDEVTRTGHVTVNGVSLAMDAALDDEDAEAAKRQKQYIGDKAKWELLGIVDVSASMGEYANGMWSELLRLLSTAEGRMCRIKVEALKDDVTMIEGEAKSR